MPTPKLTQASPRKSPYREVLHLKQVNRDVKVHAPLKAAVCIVIAIVLYTDIYYISLINRIVHLPLFADYIKSALCAFMLLLAIGHVGTLLFVHLSAATEIDAPRARLLSISSEDAGFKVTPENTPVANKSGGGARSPSIEKLPLGSFCLPSAQNSFNDSSLNTSVLSNSWQFQNSMNSGKPSVSYKSSPSYEKLRAKNRFPNARALDWHIEDEQSAEAYILERSREQSFVGSINEDLDLSISPKKPSVIDTGVEAIQRLFKAQPYKVASPSQAGEKNKSRTESGSAVICRRWHIDEHQLFKWNERIRFWFHTEIFCPLRNQIDEINKTIASLGFGKDNMIGVASPVQLRHLAALKGTLLPGLDNIIPCLEITSNQQYLVGRIREFCIGGALSEMNWCRGGAAWNEQLPPDAELLIRAFCAYIDLRLIADPEFPDGRQFTRLHFRNSVGIQGRLDTNAISKEIGDRVVIHQTKRLPPHFLMQIGDDVVDVGEGSNNALHTIILFLNYHKVKREAMMCRMSMGPCGLDLLRIIT